MNTHTCQVRINRGRMGMISLATFITLIVGNGLVMSHAYAQKVCGTKDPTYEQSQIVQEKISRWLRSKSRIAEGGVTIPVAFHIVRTSTSEGDVSDARIATQVDILNSSFANTNFRFSLLSTDRVNNDTWAYDQDEEGMKQYLAVDPEHVLNFYTLYWLNSGWLGYSYTPDEWPEDSHMHGVVCHNKTLPDGTFPEFDGDTGVHEVGHYVGLYHTFLNSCTPPGDWVDDTPYEGSPSGECNDKRDTCPEDPGNDPIHNFMDYTPDACMTHFTAGQSNRMTAMMLQYRPSMFTFLQVQVSQKRETGDVLEGTFVGRWEEAEFNEYEIPIQTPFSFVEGFTEVLRGSQALVSGPTEKYNNWSGLSDVRNHHSFLVDGSFSDLVSNFKRSYADVIIKTDLLDAPGTTEGNIQFHDPWYIDSVDEEHDNNFLNRGMTEPKPFYNRSVGSTGWQPDFTTIYPEGPYEYNGVFLEQSGPPQWNPPYYSIGAPSPQTIGNLESYFVNWQTTAGSASFQNATAAATGVVFNLAGTTVTARYKAHLGSSTSAATGSNGQRKLVRADNFLPYSLGYESAGEIWFTSSEDAETWEPEIRISNGNNYYSAPSLATAGSFALESSSDENQVYMIYRRWDVYNYKIYSRIRDGSTWLAPMQVNMGGIVNADPHPVIARTNVIVDELPDTPELHAVWETQNGLMTAYSRYDGDHWKSWEGHGYLTGAGYFRPSLAPPKVDGAERRPVILTYDNNSDVFKRQFLQNWSTAETVPASIAPVSYASQVASNTFGEEDEVYVVWEAWGDSPPPPGTDGGDSWGDAPPPTQRRVMYQQKSGANWLSAHEFRSETQAVNYYRPSIGNLSNGNLVWTWDNGSSEYVATHDGSAWTLLQSMHNTNLHTNVAVGGTSSLLDALRYTSTEQEASAPYRIGISEDELTSPTGGTLATAYGRRVEALIPDSTNGAAFFSLEIGNIGLTLTNRERVTLGFEDDTTRGLDELSAWRQLATRRMTLPAGVDSITIEGRGVATRLTNLIETGESQLRLAFDLIDAETGDLIRHLGAERRLNRDTTDILRIREGLADLAGREVIVRPSLFGLARKRREMIFTMVHVHTVLDDTAAPPALPLAKGVGEEHQTGVPSSFALHQNYPNPFNPATEIRFDLPEAGTVSLVVYDVLGRKIAELVDGYQQAGYHSATWSATDQASGVYFARFTVLSSAGSVKYSKINKLVLLR